MTCTESDEEPKNIWWSNIRIIFYEEETPDSYHRSIILRKDMK